MRTRWSAPSAISADKPCDSGPNSQAVGLARSASVERRLAVHRGRQHLQPGGAQRARRRRARRARRRPESRRCCPPKRAGTCRCRGRRCARRGSRPPPPSRRRCGLPCPRCPARRSRRERRPAAVRPPAHRPAASQASRTPRPAPPESRCRTTPLRHVRSPGEPATCAAPRNDEYRSAADSVTKTSRTSPRAEAASTRLRPSARNLSGAPPGDVTMQFDRGDHPWPSVR